MSILTGLTVINSVAVANIEALLAAIPPDRELHEPRKDLWKGPIELPRVDFAGDQANDVSAAARLIAAGTVGMAGSEPPQDSGASQKIMDQGIGGDQLQSDLQPVPANVSGANQNAGQGHSEDLVRDPVDILQRFDQGIASSRGPSRTRFVERLAQPIIDPANEIAIGHIANKQIQAVGHLIEMTVSQMMAWQWAGRNVVGLGASAGRFLVPATMKMPVRLQLRATWSLSQIFCGLSARSPGHGGECSLQQSGPKFLEN